MPRRFDALVSLWHNFMRIPLVRVLVALLFLIATLAATRIVIVAPLREALAAGDGSSTEILFRAAYALAALAAYCAYVRSVERRPVFELSLPGAVKEFGFGALLGMGLATAMMGTLWLLGHYQPAGFGDWAAIPVLLGYSLMPAVAEEVFFRGAVLRVAEESLGTWFALPFSALLFGAYHSSNPGVGAFSTIVVTLTGGVLLAAAFVLTRRLWLAIGIHVAWNFTQPGIFGVVTDGRDYDGLLEGRMTGPAVLSGGSYGPQASAIALVLCLVAGTWLLVWAARGGKWSPTAWGLRSALYGGVAMLVAGLLAANSWQFPAFAVLCAIAFTVGCVVLRTRHKA